MVIEAAMTPEGVAVFEAAVVATRGYAHDYGMLPANIERQFIDGNDLLSGPSGIEYVATNADEWIVVAGARKSIQGVESYITATWRVTTSQNGIVDLEISLALGQGYNSLQAQNGRITMYWEDNGHIQEQYAQFPRKRGVHKHLLPPDIRDAFNEVGAQELISAIVQNKITPPGDVWKDKKEVLAAISGVMVV